MNKIRALRRTKLFGSLNDEELEWLAKHAVQRHLASGEMLFLSGDPAAGLFVVAKGRVRVFQQNMGGREQVMHVDTPGSTIGDVPVFDDGPYPASAAAEEETEVLFIAREKIRQLCVNHPPFALGALKIMAERVRKHARLIHVLSLHEVGQRLALLLMAEAERVGVQGEQGLSFKLALSNHDIATRIGSVRDVVSRGFARLQTEGLILLKTRSVTIIDVRQLRLYADNRR